HAEENDAGSTEAVKPAAKKGVGRAKESKAKEEKKPETDEGSEEGDSGDDEEPKLGLLDQPLELSGSRQRKKVERLEVSFQQPAKEKTEVPQGKGTPLGQCPRIENEINKHKADSLKGLHKILFNRAGAPMEIKKNLKKFSGFTFDKDSADYDKKKKALIKYSVPPAPFTPKLTAWWELCARR
ncbi:protein DEK isoform X2, partial [Ixodes scapularis]